MLQKRNLVPDFLIQFLAVRSALKFQSYILHRQSNTSVRTNCTTIRKLKKTIRIHSPNERAHKPFNSRNDTSFVWEITYEAKEHPSVIYNWRNI